MKPEQPTTETARQFPIDVVIALGGAAILLIVLWIGSMSDDFAYESPFTKRPVIEMVKAFIGATIIYLCVCVQALVKRRRLTKVDLFVIVGFAIALRWVLVTTHPILEIDLYRYIWDGKVTIENGNPYEYGPREFVQWQWQAKDQMNFSRDAEDAKWLQEFAKDQGKGSSVILSRIHYGHFTSPYPPVSQAVFALTQCFTAHQASLDEQVTNMKIALVLFDLGVGLVLLLLLRELKLPEHLVVCWLWCPLVLKEFANGGHLDSIAIFFCMLGLLFAVRYWQRQDSLKDGLLSALWLACGIGAKIFPVFIVPLWALLMLRKNLGRGIVCIAVLVAISAAVMYPMIAHVQHWKDTGKIHAKPGILAFAEGWEMNDLLFMVVVENLKPYAKEQPSTIWFSKVDLETRNQITDAFLKVSPDPDNDEAGKGYAPLQQRQRAAFRMTRMGSLGIVALILAGYGIILLRAPPESVPMEFLNACCVALAWFWLLSPTQNPWYWCWALPLIVFARSKTWFLVSLVSLIYYLRFHYDYNAKVADFDFYVPFLEFGPVLILLLAEGLIRFSRARNGGAPADG